MFGHDSAPARIYSYGARPPLEIELVDRQMYLAHKYKNSLIEIELRRRALVDASLAEMSPRLYRIEEDITASEVVFDAAETALKKAQSEARKKVRPKDLTEALVTARAHRNALYEERKTLRAILFKDPEWVTLQESIDEGNNVARKEAYAVVITSGLYWGTVGFVNNSMSDIRKGAPPEFKCYNGNGHLTVQLQRGLSIAEMFSCSDSRLRVNPVPAEAWLPGGNKLRRTVVQFRIGSMKAPEKGKPIFATIPIILHRDIPSDASVQYVHLIRNRIGRHCEWKVQFSLARKSGWAPQDRSFTGAVGIDVGWRMRPDGSLRVAYFIGEDGYEGELALDAGWLKEMGKVRDIQSIRKTNFNETLKPLHLLLSGLELPEWMKVDTETLLLWKGQGRLAALTVRWRTRRFSGDEVAFELAENWRKRYNHLYDYEANLRNQLRNNRHYKYRFFAAEIRRRYRDIKIEDHGLQQLHKLPKTEEPSKDGAIMEHARDACISELRQCLLETSAVVKVSSVHTTSYCATCRSLEKWDRKLLTHTCSKCGQVYDQDRNAAVNILRSEPIDVEKDIKK